MLDDCLHSLCEHIRPTDIEIVVIVIDNDPGGSAREIVAGYMDAAPFVVRYLHEPRRGIAFARNAALDAAQESGAKWIAFIDDDDEIAALAGSPSSWQRNIAPRRCS